MHDEIHRRNDDETPKALRRPDERRQNAPSTIDGEGGSRVTAAGGTAAGAGSAGVAPRPDRDDGGKGLKTGAIGLVSSIVIGVASTAPAYSLAATLGLVVVYCGLQAPSQVYKFSRACEQRL